MAAPHRYSVLVLTRSSLWWHLSAPSFKLEKKDSKSPALQSHGPQWHALCSPLSQALVCWHSIEMRFQTVYAVPKICSDGYERIVLSSRLASRCIISFSNDSSSFRKPTWGPQVSLSKFIGSQVLVDSMVVVNQCSM